VLCPAMAAQREPGGEGEQPVASEMASPEFSWIHPPLCIASASPVCLKPGFSRGDARRRANRSAQGRFCIQCSLELASRRGRREGSFSDSRVAEQRPGAAGSPGRAAAQCCPEATRSRAGARAGSCMQLRGSKALGRDWNATFLLFRVIFGFF